MTDDQTIAERLRAIPTTLAADLLKDHAIAELSVSGFPVSAGPASAFAGPVKAHRLPAWSAGAARRRTAAELYHHRRRGSGEVLVLCAGGSDNGAVLATCWRPGHCSAGLWCRG